MMKAHFTFIFLFVFRSSCEFLPLFADGLLKGEVDELIAAKQFNSAFLNFTKGFFEKMRIHDVIPDFGDSSTHPIWTIQEFQKLTYLTHNFDISQIAEFLNLTRKMLNVLYSQISNDFAQGKVFFQQISRKFNNEL